MKRTTVPLLLRAALFPLVILALVFTTAGRLSYWQGWVYGAANLLALAANWLLLRDRPDLIEERLKPGEGMKRWDRVYFALSTPLYFVAIGLAGLDAGRFGWGPPLPAWAYALACVVHAAGQACHLWAKRTNRWFATVVRIQHDRGQVVCDRGPYRWVRHPGYLGGILFMLTTPLLLGSLLGVVPQAAAAGLLVWRASREDRTLQEELPGYAEYARRVRHRLLPLG